MLDIIYDVFSEYETSTLTSGEILFISYSGSDETFIDLPTPEEIAEAVWNYENRTLTE